MSILEEITKVIDIIIASGIITVAVMFWFQRKSDKKSQKAHEAGLRKVLTAYIEVAHEDLKKYDEEYTKKQVEKLIGKVKEAEKKGEKYTPHIIYTKTKGITISDVVEYYGFLDQEVIGALTRCIIEVDYLEAIYEEFNTEYVRGFDAERKTAIIKEWGEAEKNAYTAVSALMEKLNDQSTRE